MISYLGIFDMVTSTTTRVLETDVHIEAPNWAPDSTWLLVNGGGRLYRVPLDAPDVHPIDTGFATRCNNDHGIAADGRTIIFTHHTPDGPLIFTIPVAGGTPTLITSEPRCYWHGWSPDGSRIVFTAKRDGIFGVSTSAPDGSDEKRLTPPRGFCDGPDYTPDGEWIWFNGDLSGTMQLWRMRTDGTDQQQMTNDDRVNWFPHPNPVTGEVLYLSYPPGTEGHPADCEVELRLLDPGSGKVRTLVQLFGGQGTLNVPCWAADGKRFAFMHFARPDSKQT
eukprot:TRINITY_DN11416_c4_g4_i6.p1 TRINITY_DN11416_c4_g4~~TRINITY_DN11416_c4_g4_i6.p1  ORF type:complete len:279 (+),score=46.98 TRINITY_DN11416_c4_g4_i6:173-1009(+)